MQAPISLGSGIYLGLFGLIPPLHPNLSHSIVQ